MIDNNMIIKENETIKDAMVKINKNAKKIVFLVDENNKFLGTISDGDIRRAILSNYNLEEKAANIACKEPIFLFEWEKTKEKIRESFNRKSVQIIPILNSEHIVVGYIEKGKYESSEKKFFKKEIPVVIMAGGKGTRLYPFTNIIPKSMFPINEKPILQIILDKFIEQQYYKFYILINYKKEIIKSYFQELHYEIQFIEEDKFLGTAGGLHYLKKFIDNDFIVTNSDILLDINYDSLIDFHRKNESNLTIVASHKEFEIPYGVLKTNDEGKLLEFKEKPVQNYLINTGVYILNRRALNFLDGTFMDMNELIKKNGEINKVFVYPIFNNWFDIGQWSEYKRTLKYFEQTED